METYIVKVNGEVFEVEIEKKGSAPAAESRSSEAASAPAKPAAKKSAGAGEPVVCGTSGKVFKITAHEGEIVKSGDTIVVLEAMKMEIPVVSPKDGRVSKITVSEGDSTAAGQTVAYVE